MGQVFPRKFDRKFKHHWPSYLIQSACAGLGVFTLFVALSTQQAVIVASVGSSAFVVFAMPRSVPARPWNLVGGQFLGLACGAFFFLIPHNDMIMVALACALAVGSSMLLMVSLNAEHPPASGTALALALDGASVELIIAVMGSVVLLALIHAIIGRHLRDLV